jgi:hypothetical protein
MLPMPNATGPEEPEEAVPASPTAMPPTLAGTASKTKAMLLAPNAVVQAPLARAMVAACHTHGIALECRSTADRSVPLGARMAQQRQVIAWGMRMPHAWYGAGGRRCLYLENGLLAQSSGVWIDSGGRWENSRLCTEREYERPVSAEESAELRRHVERHLRHPLLGWQLPREQRVLVALQRPVDAPLLFHFPAAGQRHADPIGVMLKLLKEHLPVGPTYLLRPHPRHRKEWAAEEEGRKQTVWRDDWRTDASDDVYELVSGCSAVVAVNSTLATEALALGVPVATLGSGCWTGSQATLECDRQPELLDGLMEWHTDADKATRLLAAILRHQLSYHATAETVAAHPDFQRWISTLDRDAHMTTG